MNFLKKILGAKNEENKSLDSAKDSTSQKVFVPRAPRIRLTPLHNIHFSLVSPIQTSNLSLSNLSVTGAGLLRDGLQEWPEQGSSIAGKIRTKDQEIDCSAKIVHLSPKVAGCHFETNLVEIRQMVLRYFQFELEALKMIRVKSELLQAQPDGQPRWFSGDNGTDLYFVESDGKLVRFRLTFFGNHIEGTLGEKTKVGHVVDDEVSEDVRYKGASLIKFSTEEQGETLNAAVRFLENIEGLTDRERAQILAALR